jgi:uncharacterized protein (TIGR03083 family)
MEPRTSRLDHSTSMALAATEYDRCVAHLRRLTEDDWTKPTDCSAWNVRQMAAHMLGMAAMVTSVREMIRQQRLADRRGGGIDNLTALQVDERADWSPARIIERFAETGPRAVTWRRRVPGVIRNRRLPELQRVNGAEETWTLGFLFDVILTRDPWMHRTDLAQATHTPLDLTAEHDGIIVAGVVEEWADRHGKDFDLILTGPAGGRWTVGDNGPVINLDAIEFCRVLSARRDPVGLDELLSTEVPF